MFSLDITEETERAEPQKANPPTKYPPHLKQQDISLSLSHLDSKTG
jgi:hypothetical protein